MNAHEVVKKDLGYIVGALKKELGLMSGTDLLVTGGGGFLGYYLIKSALRWNELNKNKIRLWVVDNFARGLPEWLFALKKRNGLHIIKHDIADSAPKTRASFSYIIHAASIASPFYYRLHPIETMDANVEGLRYLLDYTLKRKKNPGPVKGFLSFSTSEIYGDPTPENIPTPEAYRGNVSSTGPRACYDESKRYGETLAVNFARHHNLPIKIARPFNNYGPGLKITDRRVIPDFARNIFENKDIIIYSDGTPTRTFCYVADAVIGYYKVLTKGSPAEAYNIGTSAPEISILKLAQLMVDIGKKYFGYSGMIIHRESRDKQYLADVPNRRCPDITKARKELGYSPAIDINEGLLRAMYWYSENHKCKEES